MTPLPLRFAILFGLLWGMPAVSEESPKTAQAAPQLKKYVYKSAPRRTLTVHFPEGWKPTDRRAALVIFRCRIPAQREHFRRLGMVVVKPLLAPVNSGRLPQQSLREIATLPRPRHQVEDAKSVIRFLRANASNLGIDPQRIVATGTSGGGDLALQTVINTAFEDANDDRTVSHRPDGLVLYCPAFDGIDIWFVRTEELHRRTKAEAPAFLPHLDSFAKRTPQGYAVPLDHRAKLIGQAATLGKREGIEENEIAKFQQVLELFNVRDWQLLHPVEDALKMSATRILPEDPLPPTLIMYGDRDHLRPHQLAFVKAARAAGKTFELEEYRGGGHSFMTQPAFESVTTTRAERFLRDNGFLPALGNVTD